MRYEFAVQGFFFEFRQRFDEMPTNPDEPIAAQKKLHHLKVQM